MFGSNGNRPYRQPGQAVEMVTVQDTNATANKGGGILGFFANMFSASSKSSRSSSGYLQPTTSAPPTDVVFCQPVEGVACQPMETVVCQPVEGIACQPVTMMQGPPQGA